MDDAAFGEQFKPVHVPPTFDEAENLQDQVIFALAELNEGKAEHVIRKLESLKPDAPTKVVIANAHQILTELYEKSLIAGNGEEGGLVYNLHKVTRANDGKVNPTLLVPGLD
ncbi:hypothetical protein [Mucilaginibacter sp. UR6-11]|uniref:hypothetical protein n=1 Tax=Mucilaginibacter sp. UR6-11 TaxID=1435644 RepID=UPI001E385FAA|nr:hypothetical protein [Mucilaginibacter sp. UR6-11]MCC8426339.1 hypothetical protein [Mucilaginibacter sp. UR6-11]